VPKLGDIPPEIDPKPGEAVVVSFDTSSDVGEIHGDRGTSYAFPVVLADGRRAVLKGGKRLLTAVQGAIGNRAGTFKLKVIPTGTKGTLAREWTCVEER
jgi:hypothetical protein